LLGCAGDVGGYVFAGWGGTAPVAQRLEGVGYTFGLAALDARTLIAIHQQTLSVLTDAGYNWSAAPTDAAARDQLLGLLHTGPIPLQVTVSRSDINVVDE